MDDHRELPVPVHLTARIEGVVLPTWLSVCFAASAAIAAVALLLVWMLTREMAREIRVLELHVQDVEAVMIQQGLAKRDNFAIWGSAPQRTRPPARESEK